VDKKKSKNPLREERFARQMVQPKGRTGVQPQKSVAAAYATGQISKAPAITMSRETCRVRHRELIFSITGSTPFTVQQSFALNPGLAATFPWLSTMAQSWEKYRFRMLRFCVYTRTGSNVPGSLMLVPDYNAADPPPTSEQMASSYEDVAEDAPWKDIVCSLSSKAMSVREHLFTRTGPLGSNLDIKTYDVGNLHVCTIDGTAVNWGKLWVEYDVDFFVPQLPSNPFVAPLPSGNALSNGGETAANPFGTSPGSSFAGGVTIDGLSNFTLPSVDEDDIVFSFYIEGTGLTAIGNPTVTGGIALGSNSLTLTTGTLLGGYFTFTSSGPGTISFNGITTATTVTQAFAIISLTAEGDSFHKKKP